MQSVALSIITVGYKNYEDILKTLNSVDSQNIEPYENILILKGLNEVEKTKLLNKYNFSYRKFYFDIDTSIFNAMNIGIKKATGKYIMFLNSGDLFYSKNSIKLINSKINPNTNFNYSFKTLQKYKDLNIIRNNNIFKNDIFYYPPPHQGFIAPLDQNLLYNEKLKVSADNEWMLQNTKKRKTKILNEILCIFQLGGQSTYPYLSTIFLFYKYETRVSLIKVLIKFFISIFLSKKQYYKFIAKRRSYKFYESK